MHELIPLAQQIQVSLLWEGDIFVMKEMHYRVWTDLLSAGGPLLLLQKTKAWLSWCFTFSFTEIYMTWSFLLGFCILKHCQAVKENGWRYALCERWAIKYLYILSGLSFILATFFNWIILDTSFKLMS